MPFKWFGDPAKAPKQREVGSTLVAAPSQLPASGSPQGAWHAQLWGPTWSPGCATAAGTGNNHQAVTGSRYITPYTSCLFRSQLSPLVHPHFAYLHPQSTIGPPLPRGAPSASSLAGGRGFQARASLNTILSSRGAKPTR